MFFTTLKHHVVTYYSSTFFFYLQLNIETVNKEVFVNWCFGLVKTELS